MKNYMLLLVVVGFVPINFLIGQTYFHPTSGTQQVVLGPGTVYYYDNGGPNGPYAPNLSSSITFTPQDGYFIENVFFSEFHVEDEASCNYDKLTYQFLPNCLDLFVSYDECGGPKVFSFAGPCVGESLTFSFESDGSIEESGWRAEIIVSPKNPDRKICHNDATCPLDVGVVLDCDGGGPTISQADPEGRNAFDEEFYCWAFGKCKGQIDQYPGCSNQLFPGGERIYPLFLSQSQTIVIECECLTDLFLVNYSTCGCLAKVPNVGGQFIIDNLPAGNYYLVAEYDCAGDLCFCDFQFTCLETGPGILDCSQATPIWCNSSDLSSNSAAAGGMANVNSYCNPSLGSNWTGRERVYSFYSDINGIVQISLGGLSANLDLIVLKSCERTDCVASSTKGGVQTETITLNVKKGETYLIVVDGVNFAQSNYSLEVQCEEQESCIECGQCFTYSLVNKGLNTDIICRSKYVDCTYPDFPTPSHSFRWTIDGIQASTAQNPTLSVPTHKQVTICQEVRLNNNISYQCCWVVSAIPGCQSTPIAHWVHTSGPLNPNVVLDASGSEGAFRYYWDFGDGSPMISTNQDPIAIKTYVPPQPQKATCVYVQNSWGISQYCKTFAPGAFECATSPSPKFDYSLVGNTISITSDNPSGIIKEWEIDYGNGTIVNGTDWSTQAQTYMNAGTYEVCIRFRVESGQAFGIPCSFDGCLYFTVKVGCCITVRDNCSDLWFNFLNEDNGFLYALSRSMNLNQEAIGWEINDEPVANSASNTVQYLFPVSGLYKICFIYRDATTGCFVKCCRYIWIGNPFDCGSIFFWYEEGKGYQFYTEANGSDFTWTNDDTGEEIGQGEISNFIPVPGPGDCIEVNISVRYFDISCNCWRICCLRIYLCDPTECQGEITVITQPGPGGSTALCVDNSLTSVRWTCLDNNQYIGDGNCINITNLSCQVYCVQYYDPVAKRYRVCCLDWTSGLQEPQSLTKIEIRPNPFRDLVGVTVEFSHPLETRLELLDMYGRATGVGVLERGPDLLHQFQVDTRQLASGIYTLRIVTAEGEIIRRVIKQ